jgi:hypothetical protein
MPPRGATRIQWARKDRKGSAKLTVPVAIARLVSDEALFQCQLTDEGILYRYVNGQQPVELPRWMS